MSKLRRSAVTISAMHSTVFVVKFASEPLSTAVGRSDWTIDDDIQRVVPDYLSSWPAIAEAPGLGDPSQVDQSFEAFMKCLSDQKRSVKPSLTEPQGPTVWSHVASLLISNNNELQPSRADLQEMRRASRRGLTDVIPPNGSPDCRALHQWQPGPNVPAPRLSISFRLPRAIRLECRSHGPSSVSRLGSQASESIR